MLVHVIGVPYLRFGTCKSEEVGIWVRSSNLISPYKIWTYFLLSFSLSYVIYQMGIIMISSLTVRCDEQIKSGQGKGFMQWKVPYNYSLLWNNSLKRGSSNFMHKIITTEKQKQKTQTSLSTYHPTCCLKGFTYMDSLLTTTNM